MGERMTWEEILQTYPNEWVLLIDYVLEHGQMKEGTLIKHSKNKEEVFSYPTDAEKAALWHTGTPYCGRSHYA